MKVTIVLVVACVAVAQAFPSYMPAGPTCKFGHSIGGGQGHVEYGAPQFGGVSWGPPIFGGIERAQPRFGGISGGMRGDMDDGNFRGSWGGARWGGDDNFRGSWGGARWGGDDNNNGWNN